MDVPAPACGCSTRSLGAHLHQALSQVHAQAALDCGLLQLKGSVKTCVLGVCISGDVKTVSAKGKAASAGE